MLIGHKWSFAIEIDVIEVVDDWIFGVFVFWLAGEVAGDPRDRQVDLKGCISWLKDFTNNPKNRFEPNLYDMDLNRAFLLLNASVIAGDKGISLVKEPYDNVFSRFHIEHLGMSSFDQLNIVLIENERLQQRCIWQQTGEEIKEAYLKKGQMQDVARLVVEYFVSEQNKFT